MTEIPNVFDIADRDDLIDLYIGNVDDLSEAEIDDFLNEDRAVLDELGDDAKLKALGRLCIKKRDFYEAKALVKMIKNKSDAKSLMQQILDSDDEELAMDDSWITVNSSGKEGAGSPVLLGEGGEIKSGMGGKFTGKTMGEVKSASKTPTTRKEIKAAMKKSTESKSSTGSKYDGLNEGEVRLKATQEFYSNPSLGAAGANYQDYIEGELKKASEESGLKRAERPVYKEDPSFIREIKPVGGAVSLSSGVNDVASVSAAMNVSGKVDLNSEKYNESVIDSIASDAGAIETVNGLSGANFSGMYDNGSITISKESYKEASEQLEAIKNSIKNGKDSSPIDVGDGLSVVVHESLHARRDKAMKSRYGEDVAPLKRSERAEAGINEGLTEFLTGKLSGDYIKGKTGYSGQVRSGIWRYFKQVGAVDDFFMNTGSESADEHFDALSKLYFGGAKGKDLRSGFIDIAMKTGATREKANREYRKMELAAAI